MTEQEEYDKAFADMAAEPLDIDERQRFEELRAEYDTAERKKDRQQQRRNRLKAAAKKAGFETIDKLAAAILDGSATVTK